MKRALLLPLIFATVSALSQPTLLPSLGIGGEPDPSDAICPIPLYLGDFYSTGIQVGDTCADFTLYNRDGDAFNLEQTLTDGKPVLMISGSYTCPVFRNKIDVINQMIQQFGADLEVVVIYGIEAHPYGEISPYFGYENPGQANLNQGILYAQPTTYGERLAIAEDMFAAENIDPEIVFFEGPCQPWWDFYGPAPQNSYLIDTSGIVYSKHGWFDKFPDDIECDILQYFGLPMPNCNDSANGTFVVEIIDSLVVGDPGATLFAYANLINNSAEDVLVDVFRMQEQIPADWETSMCITACLLPEIDRDTVLIEAGATQSFSVDYYTSSIPNTGSVRMGFRNVNNQSNQFSYWFLAETNTNSLAENGVAPIRIFPNPTEGVITISSELDVTGYFINDLNGKTVESGFLRNSQITFSDRLDSGLYLLNLELQDGSLITQRVLINRAGH